MVVKPLQSLVAELGHFLRRYEVEPSVSDNEDGTHTVTYAAEYAGFYGIEISLASVPVGDSPYRSCICNPTIAFPPSVSFAPLAAANAASLPDGVGACDMLVSHDNLCVLKSQPVAMTGGRRAREYVHYYQVTSNEQKWDALTLRGAMPPPPASRVCVGVDESFLALCHDEAEPDGAAGPGPISDIRCLDLSEPAKVEAWTALQADGRPPNSVGGYATAVWEGRHVVLCSGGVDAKGQLNNDIWMLSLGNTRLASGAGRATWRVLSEWPSSIFSGDGFSERTHHTMVHLPNTSAFYIFGGRGPQGELLNDLYVFDMDDEQWTMPQSLSELPPPREHHAACFVGERERERARRAPARRGAVASPTRDVPARPPAPIPSSPPTRRLPRDPRRHRARRQHDLGDLGVRHDHRDLVERRRRARALAPPPRLARRRGVHARRRRRRRPAGRRLAARLDDSLLRAGAERAPRGPAADPPRTVPCPSLWPPSTARDATPTPPPSQSSCFDFLGNSAQAIVVKQSASLAAMKNAFACEVVMLARTFSTYSPMLVKCDPGFKSGFGLVGLEHPAYKGDPEEGPWVHFFVGPWSPSGGGAVAQTRIDMDVWTHVAGVYTGTHLLLFINGTLKSSVEFTTNEEEAEALHSKSDLTIGGIPGKFAFDGLIDMARLWSEPRLEGQIREAMNTPFAEPSTPGLLGQWTFNEGAGEQIVDSSGSRNHATFDRYAGGVELRRVQSRRPKLEPLKTEREKHIDACFMRLQAWKNEFEDANGRLPAKADVLMAEPEIVNIARRLGELDKKDE